MSSNFINNPFGSNLGTNKQNTEAQLRGVELRDFLTKTYANLLLGVIAFVLSCYLLIVTGIASKFALLYTNMWVSLGLILVFTLSTTFFINFTYASKNPAIQYLGLFGYAILQSLFVSPVVLFASIYGNSILPAAGGFTLALFALMTIVVYVTGIDFGFLRSTIIFASIASLIVIVVSVITGFKLGIFFTGFMIILACCYILYDTSNIMKDYRSTQPIAAATALLGAIIMLFVNIVQFLMQLRD